jgi:hypothetical protein
MVEAHLSFLFHQIVNSVMALVVLGILRRSAGRFPVQSSHSCESKDSGFDFEVKLPRSC